MAADITNDTQFLTAVAQLIHDGQNGHLDQDKAKKIQTYLIAKGGSVTGTITQVQGNH